MPKPQRKSKAANQRPARHVKPVSRALIKPDLIPSRKESLAVTVSQAIENTLIIGDLKTLSPEQRVEYAKAFAKSLGINILTRPFDYILFREYDGSPERLELYLNAKGAAQLRKIHRISVIPGSLKREIVDEHCMVTVDVRDGWGSTDSATGSLSLFKFKDGRKIAFTGREWDNAIMKCETKAKRRATLSICGLAMLDESQLDTMQVIGGVTPEGRIFRYQDAEVVAPQLDENAAHGHPGGSERAKQAEEALRRVEEADKALSTEPPAKASPEPAVTVPKANPAPPMEPAQYDGTIILDYDLGTPQAPVVRGDIANVLPILQKHCTLEWKGDWWHCQAKDVKTIMQIAHDLNYKLEEVHPKSSARTAVPEAAKGRSGGKQSTGTATPPVVSGTIQRSIAGLSGKTPVRDVTVLLADGTKPTYRCWDMGWFEALDAGVGKAAQLVMKQNKQYMNIVGALQIGAKQWLEDGTPVIQKDREPGSL